VSRHDFDKLASEKVERLLNQYGYEGWELCFFGARFSIFKREVEK
jgi:hypothetical protein